MVAITLTAIGFVAFIIDMMIVFSGVKTAYSWSKEANSAYYALSRISASIIIMMGFFSISIGRKSALHLTFKFFTQWPFILSGNVIFIFSLLLPIVMYRSMVGTDRDYYLYFIS